MRSRRSKQPSERRAGAVKKEEAATARRVRTRIRKPRYVSLTRLDRMAEEVEEMVERDEEMEMTLIELFPMRTAAVVSTAAAEDVSRISEFFFTDECDSLTGLLDSEAISVSVEVSPVFEGAEREEKLVRAALRSKERDESEEKWVCYSEVVEDVSSSAVDGCGRAEDEDEERRRVLKLKRLSLKLDYQEVLDAWDGGRSLFVGDGDCAQIVPGFDADELFAGDSNGAWRVPDQKAKTEKKDEEFMLGNWEEDELRWKMGQIREASLLRYKEKRRNRLFSKRIRYEVRKLNAEKRPRIKGRFVKRD